MCIYAYSYTLCIRIVSYMSYLLAAAQSNNWEQASELSELSASLMPPLAAVDLLRLLSTSSLSRRDRE